LKDLTTDDKLIRLLRKGDMVAFDTIYQRYSNKLYFFVLRYIKLKEDVEEIVQEVFIKIWESRKNIDTHLTFESFIFTIAYNTTISLLRKRISEQKYLEKLRSIQQITSADYIINEIQFKELNAKMLVLLEQLTPRQREIYQLSRESGLSHDEIAEKLDISSNTVKNHLVKALALIKINIDNGVIANVLFFSLFFQ
jgi:RNA polymerase sigma-70 factor (ECF subfamily)